MLRSRVAVEQNNNSGVNIQAQGDVSNNNINTTDKFIELLKEKDKQINKYQQQMDRIISMLEGKR